MLGFLSGHPLAGTQLVKLPIQRAPKEEATFLHLLPEEEVKKIIEVVDSEEHFDVFDHPSSVESPYASSVYLPSA